MWLHWRVVVQRTLHEAVCRLVPVASAAWWW